MRNWFFLRKIQSQYNQADFKEVRFILHFKNKYSKSKSKLKNKRMKKKTIRFQVKKGTYVCQLVTYGRSDDWLKNQMVQKF